jgi:GT2 family glycosyltransferase
MNFSHIFTKIINWWQRLRIWRLYGILLLAKWLDSLFRYFPHRPIPALKAWVPGISIIIPERANPEMLAECLASLYMAASQINEPYEIIIVVNGSPLSDYQSLIKQYPDIRWLHSRQPLGFVSAIRQGVKLAKYDGVYLLNNDMTLESNALAEILKWRAPPVFAIASQIFFTEKTRRREETGWTDFRFENGHVQLFDVPLEDDVTVRGHLYAGGGASLFRRQLLLQKLTWSDPYHPFYWEDVEWGVRAWREGYEVLFCPTSKVWHRHRATVYKFFTPVEVERIFQRNGKQFELRNLLGMKHKTPLSVKQIIADIRQLPIQTQNELACLKNGFALLLAQIHASRAPQRDMSLHYLRRKYYPTPFAEAEAKPVLIVVSPYAIYPPAHGGAVRIYHLIKTVSQKYRIVIISDEEELYTTASIPYFSGCYAVHLIGGRYEKPEEIGRRIPRIHNHSHAILKNELKRIIASYCPVLVQIEYIELAELITIGKQNLPWFLTLHDVLFDANKPTEADYYEQALIKRYDRVIVCSEEDAALLNRNHIVAQIVPNGTEIHKTPYMSSQGGHFILFVGAFRYQPNLRGIQTFINRVYPQLRLKIPHLELVILGGHNAPQIAKKIPGFQQTGIQVLDYVKDVQKWLQRCALTINPQYGIIRGSSIKLIESLAARRVCVSTTDGARGFLKAGFSSLITVEQVEEMIQPLEKLLCEEDYRLSLEKPSLDLLQNYTWTNSANKLLLLYENAILSTEA